MEKLIELISLILANPENANAYRELANYYQKNNSPIENKAFIQLIEQRRFKNGYNNSDFDKK